MNYNNCMNRGGIYMLKCPQRATMTENLAYGSTLSISSLKLLGNTLQEITDSLEYLIDNDVTLYENDKEIDTRRLFEILR